MAKVIVTGSINMDIVASTARLPQPGETVAGTELRFFPGGKGANQSVAAARVGAETVFVGGVGDDAFATEVLAFLAENGVDASSVRTIPGVATGVALIVVDARGENSIVVVPGANGRLAAADTEYVAINRGDIAVAQFEISTATTAAALAHARACGATTVLNAAPAQDMSRDLDDLVDVLVVNEIELNAMAHSRITPAATLGEVHAAVSRMERAAGRVTVVTLGRRGAVAVIGDRLVEVAGRAVDVVDTTGAGDCFVGTFAARLAAADGIEPALRFANAAASICVGRSGAGPSMPTIGEVHDRDS